MLSSESKVLAEMLSDVSATHVPITRVTAPELLIFLVLLYFFDSDAARE